MASQTFSLTNLSQLQKMGIYTLVALSFLTLWTGQAFGLGVALPFIAFVFLSWFWEEPRFNPKRLNTLWAVLTALVVPLFIWLTVATDTGIVRVGVFFVLYLTVAKLFQRSRLIDYAQLLALSFLLMAAATAFNDGMAYGIYFACYVVIGVITFAIHHLRMELEQAAERGARRPRQLFGRAYISVLVSMALITLVSAIVFFFVFPRFGIGFFAKKSRDGATQSGFSESIGLGSHGTIKTDNTVVMRVKFPEEKPPQASMYWRGISFDTYDGSNWSQTLNLEESLIHSEGWFSLRLWDTFPKRSESLLTQEIYLEPIGSSVMFALDRPLGIGLSEKDKNTQAWLHHKGVTRNDMNDLRFHRKNEIGYQYIIQSTLQQPPPSTLRHPNRDAVRERLQRVTPGHPDRWSKRIKAYAQLPENLDPRIKVLAEQLTATATNDFDRASMIANYLKLNFTYTTDLPDPGEQPPLSAFLFEHKRGHCEYYATAMVIMLRTIGIYARNVNGFYGGQWNDFDAYLAVRNADAHSWVEVALVAQHDDRLAPGIYWARFDPTPAAANASNTSRWYDPVAAVFDALRFKWFKYVIEYDLETQIEFLRSAGSALGASEPSAQRDAYTLSDAVASLRQNLLPALLLLVLSLVGGFIIWIRTPRKLDRWDAVVCVVVVVSGFAVAVVLWRPQAGALVRVFALLLPSILPGLATMLRLGHVGEPVVKPQGIAKLYSEARSTLIAFDIPLKPTDGPEHMLTALRQHRELPKPSAKIIERIVMHYMDIRFGGQDVLASDEEKALRKELRRIARSKQR